LIAARSAAGNRRSGGAGRKGVLGEGNSRPALAFAAAIFRFSQDKKHDILFTIFDFWYNIVIEEKNITHTLILLPRY